MNAQTVVRFRTQKLPKQTGEKARLKVAHGMDQGAVYVIYADRATIGRADDADVFLSDLKASRVHAELLRVPEGWSVKDLGSANGILWNGRQTRAAQLRIGDTLTIGETILEFYPAEAGGALLTAPAKSVGEIESIHRSIDDQKKSFLSILKVGIEPNARPKAQTSFGAQGGMNSRKLVIYGVLGLAILMTLSEDKSKSSATAKKPVTEKKAKEQNGLAERGLASYLPQAPVNEETRRYADYFFKAGFREYRERNFLRAMTNFETVLQIDPYHSLAKLYQQNCRIEMEETIKESLRRGKIALDSGKLREAKGQFESVMRLLYRDQSNPMFLEAKEQLDKTVKEMKEGGFR